MALIDIVAQHWRGIAAGVFLVAAFAGIAVALCRRRARGTLGDKAMLAMAINNMTQGVVLIDANERLLVCNDRAEEAAASRWFPSVKRFYSADHRDYLRTYARARYGLVNRVHAAFAMASFGRLAAVIGNDSRSHMAELIDVPVFDVRAMDAARLMNVWEQVRARSGDYTAHIGKRIDAIEQDYLVELRLVLERHGLV